MEEINFLMGEYVNAVINHRIACLRGEYKVANKYYEKIEVYICKIKLIPNWMDVFEELLEHEEYSVRIQAATTLLPYETKIAKKILKKCSLLPDMNGFEARMVLNEWNTENLKFPTLKNGKIIYE